MIKDKIFTTILSTHLPNDLNFGIASMPFIWWRLEN
jgi:hypothetical protein